MGLRSIHPRTGRKIADVSDGLSNTAVATETTEQDAAPWHLGFYATLGGLPGKQTAATLSSDDIQIANGRSFYAPTGFLVGQYEEDSNYTSLHANGGTYLAWVWSSPSAVYDSAGKASFAGGVGIVGPASKHTGSVNHLFGDGAVRTIPSTADPALYFFIITRAGAEPASEFFAKY